MDKKIGVYFTQPNGLGDTLLLTPALRLLRSINPDARIGVVAQNIDLLRGSPHVDLIFEAKSQGRESFEQLFVGASRIFAVDYFSAHYDLMQRHVLDVICEKVGVKYDGGLPELHLSDLERYHAQEVVAQCRTAGRRPVVVIRWTRPGPQTRSGSWNDGRHLLTPLKR